MLIILLIIQGLRLHGAIIIKYLARRYCYAFLRVTSFLDVALVKKRRRISDFKRRSISDSKKGVALAIIEKKDVELAIPKKIHYPANTFMPPFCLIKVVTL